MIKTASPTVVSAVFAILADHHKQKRLKADYLKGWQQSEKELRR